MSAPLVAVTGANGFVGGHVLAHLLATGTPTVGLVRRGRSLARGDWPKRQVDAWNEPSLRAALEGVGAIVHAASVVHRPGAAVAEYQDFNVAGTTALLAAAQSRGVLRIIFLSTIKVYGEEPVGTIDEETSIDRSSPYSATKVDAERLLLEAAARGGPAATVLRLCPVFGVGDKGNVRRVATAVARRRFVVPGSGQTRKSVVHVSKVAEAVQRSLELDARGVFVLSDRVAPSIRELADTVAAALGRRRPPSIPIPLVLGAASALGVLARVRGREAQVSPELIRKSLRSTVCSPTKLERTLNMDCHVDFREAITEEVAWLRGENLL